MSILGQLYFEPETVNGKLKTKYVGTIISFTVKKADGSLQTFESEPTVLNLQPVKYSEVADIKSGSTVYLDAIPHTVKNVFPIDGELWITKDGLDVKRVKYFEIRVPK